MHTQNTVNCQNMLLSIIQTQTKNVNWNGKACQSKHHLSLLGEQLGMTTIWGRKEKTGIKSCMPCWWTAWTHNRGSCGFTRLLYLGHESAACDWSVPELGRPPDLPGPLPPRMLNACPLSYQPLTPSSPMLYRHNTTRNGKTFNLVCLFNAVRPHPISISLCIRNDLTCICLPILNSFTHYCLRIHYK